MKREIAVSYTKEESVFDSNVRVYRCGLNSHTLIYCVSSYHSIYD